MEITYTLASQADIQTLTTLVGEYHQFESIQSTVQRRRNAIIPLIEESTLGFIAVARYNNDIIGYAAVCFGYSIELGGKDAFIDELYVTDECRGNQVGTSLLSFAKTEALSRGVLVLHLEVSRENNRAKKYYEKNGFLSRDNFHLMSCKINF